MSIEQSVKQQFAKIFSSNDWQLFKKMAESNLREAATLTKAHMPAEASLRLLARNSRKRLLIGIGVELLLKSVYLKRGYPVNKPKNAGQLKFPFPSADAAGVALSEDSTYQLNDLIQHINKVVDFKNPAVAIKGMRIAKVFRNKEGHGVTAVHTFQASNYRDIEASLVEIYRDAFSENLSVRFSLEPGEKAQWKSQIMAAK